MTRVVITANGIGSRMKGLSPRPKHQLHYDGKRIIDRLVKTFPKVEIIECYESNSRRDTLNYIKDYTDCLIVDCDIVINGNIPELTEDTVYCFKSDKDKYSSVLCDLTGTDRRIINASEHKRLSDIRCAGIYFVKSVSDLLSRMTDDNSIVSGMIGAKVVIESTSTIVPLGDPEDYYEALGIKPGSFTGNRIEMNKNTVIKYCSTGKSENFWYKCDHRFNVPKLIYYDDEMIITERIYPTTKPTAEDFVKIIEGLKLMPGNGMPFKTYLNNLPLFDLPIKLQEHEGTFFHGDLSTTNVLKNSRLWLIDPNWKNIFGSWLTDAGKAYFSFIAYEQNYPEAKKIADHFGPEVINFAVAEGLRVTKYKPEYMDIVRNIADLCQR